MAQQELSAGSFSIRPQLFRSPFAQAGAATALVCFLRQSYRDDVDQAVDMFDKLLTRTFAHAERDLDQHLREQRKTIRSALVSLRSVGTLILDDAITDVELRRRVFQTVSRQELSAHLLPYASSCLPLGR